MFRFQILANEYLARDTNAFYHLPYTGMGNPDNPQYLNDLKNTFNDFPQNTLLNAVQALRNVLDEDLPRIHRLLGIDLITICTVPRAKTEESYRPTQQLFRSTVQTAANQNRGFFDGTTYIRRHTNTKTTHLRKPIPSYNNDGSEPYVGITVQTCNISPEVRGRDILLIDDIYTPGVNIDEDAINTLINRGAHTVTFYAIGKVR